MEVETQGFLAGKSKSPVSPFSCSDGLNCAIKIYSSRKKLILGTIVAVIVIAITVTVVVVVVSKGQPTTSLEEQITISNMMLHLYKLQDIAVANSNNRAAGTSGFKESAQFIAGKLQSAGYEVTVQQFTFAKLKIIEPPQLLLHSSNAIEFQYNVDFAIMGSFDGVHNLTENAFVVPALGCDPSNYDGFPEHTIAIVSRGNCTFVEKVALAEKYNAAAVIIFNEGNAPDRVGLFAGSLNEVSIPVFAASYGVGVMLKVAPNPILVLYTNTHATHVNTTNVITETKSGRADRVIVIGSHLDSVPAGPGINDNGSGTALNLELALKLAAEPMQRTIKNKIRFAWWAAEELGLLGSTHYVNDLNATNPQELANIVVNLNFDMVGSPNFFRGIYNGSSDSSPGSAIIQHLFTQYFISKNIDAQPTAFTGRSDYGPFLTYKKAAGGLFTGAEVLKSSQERELFGGLANAAFDPCYHQACDTVDNIHQGVFGEMGKAAAHVLELLAVQDDLLSFLHL